MAVQVGIDTFNSPKPWKDKKLLEELYVNEGLSTREIATVLDCGHRTVARWLNRHGVETRKNNSSLKQSEKTCETPASFGMVRGYERWQSPTPGGMEYVRVHRLVAVAEHGFEAVCGKHVHHRNEVKWDNRPENLEILTPEEHARHHDALGLMEE